MTITAPTPEEFLASSYPEDEHGDPMTLDELVKDLQRRVTALETGAPSCDDPVCSPADPVQYQLPVELQGAVRSMEEAMERAAQPFDLSHEYADLEAKHDVVLQLIEDIRGIVKKSTSKVSLEVKAAIEAWANPQVIAAEPALEGSHTQTQTETGPDFCKECSDAISEWVVWPCAGAQRAEEPAVPHHDADVDAWREYARQVRGVRSGESSIDTMNRSQIRTLLGIGQPAGA